ncbi:MULTISPECIES: hypothetical protein [Mycobacteroides]|uniref:Uncharacterized protein n=1 Tax=Mycobacteroides immunogenum TaxID=83262 RepID=A0A7V8LJE6_9MYCO|nr:MULTISPECIES: hypothetical protein [Mycobacteroides]AMT71978.1 hypothetical protein ABG82_18435 [Mycobacteroides immunogenum]ANO05109.1 hypothetical protein BAB75_18720 [Mycobacteroides immunogenum]KIU40218.1 hypothetical protein TL11_13245 [Mycobacteroides immunogenum]KPG02874.1 hypothetical protein AN909_26585 [Mycobacteroides immunogenum]KPG02961.1 hypothetical protein AN908_27035 [Mycobacteroides immunogenum]
MTVTKVRVNKRAFRELRKSEPVQARLLEVGDVVATDANADHEATADVAKNGPVDDGPSYTAELYIGKNRARVSVATATFRAMGHERRTSSLLRAAARQ